MRSFTKQITKYIFAISLLIFSNNLFAEDRSAEVTKYIDDFGNKIISIAGDPIYTIEYRKEQLVELIDGATDTDWMAKFILARHYRTASEEQRASFKKLYREFMIHTYSPKFKGYNGEKFEILETMNQGRYYVVKCLFLPKESPEVKIDFRVKERKNKDGFIILDIIAEGISLIETQRSEFGSSINNIGLDKFLDELTQRVEELKSTGEGEEETIKASNR
ncbi:MAG: ABC transporter substrate-binding protein [Proteobacteria bacterium]|nr:ABC transporter substrate-binding protein [Pseudomonadota bacterium]